MTDLTLLHTAEGHRATFDALAARIAPGTRLHHVVRPDWLARAQNGIDADLSDEIAAAIAQAPGAVLCSCTTLGPVAGAAGTVRIDAPMMALAAQSGGPVLLAYCLDSTRAASRDLLGAAFAAVGTEGEIRLLDLTEVWPLYEAGDTDGFARAIAKRVETALANAPDTGCVVLAQASMAGAAAHVSQHVRARVPVLSSPEAAVRAALGVP